MPSSTPLGKENKKGDRSEEVQNNQLCFKLYKRFQPGTPLSFREKREVFSDQIKRGCFVKKKKKEEPMHGIWLTARSEGPPPTTDAAGLKR
jgi:hypothetical protein